MRKEREKRNRIIKSQVLKLVLEGYMLKEAWQIVARRWFLSSRSVERIYHETIIRD